MSTKNRAPTRELNHLGSVLRDSTLDISEEPLTKEMQVLLAQLELSEFEPRQPCDVPQKMRDREAERR